MYNPNPGADPSQGLFGNWNSLAFPNMTTPGGGLPLSSSDFGNTTVPDLSGIGGIGGKLPGIGGAMGPGQGGFFGNGQGFGLNAQSAQFALSGLQSLGNLWGAFQAQKLAKKSFNFQRDYANRNLENQTRSYNTQMGDRIRSRAHTEGMSQAQADAWLSQNRLREDPIGDRRQRQAGG